MRRILASLKASPLVLVALMGFSEPRLAAAADAVDATAAVNAGGFAGLPHDPGNDNGVFLDAVSTGSSSLVQPAYYEVSIPAGASSLRFAVFDGNVAGLWDQGAKECNPDGSPQVLRANQSSNTGANAVIEYDLAASGDVADAAGFVPFTTDPTLTFAIGDSEDVNDLAPPTQRPGAVLFRNANDARWEFLYDGAHDPRALVAATGAHRYMLRVRYRTGTTIPNAIAGYKIAANGSLTQRPLVFTDTLLGGFIGGVVDNRRLAFNFPGEQPELPFSVSRDHYPNILKPFTANLNSWLVPSQAPYAPAVRFGPDDPYDNPYVGTFDVHLLLVPRDGQTWEQMFTGLVIEEGDADNANPIPISPLPPNPGLPRDDGQPHTDSGGFAQNNTGYRIPVPSQIPFDPPADNSGAPWLEIFDPTMTLFATDTDTSGNVAQEDATGASFKSLKPYLPATGGLAGVWTIRMHNLDARNTWFLRTNARISRLQGVAGRVVCDAGCDGVLSGTDAGIPGVEVTVTRTDGPGGTWTATTNASGAWFLQDLPTGNYSASIDPAQPALAGKTPSTTQPAVFELVQDEYQTGVDFGYCCECACGPDGRLHRICFTADIWYPEPCTPNPDPWVYVRLDRGCECPGDMLDLADFSYEGAFPGPQSGRNGVITVNDVVIEDGVARVFVCLEATAPLFPQGYFSGPFKIEVVVNGISEKVCTPLTCDTLSIGGTIPADWHPRWCGDEPVYHVLSWVPWACIEKPCTDGCVRPRAFWRAVNKYGECDATRYAWPCPDAEDRVLCGKTWLQILRKDPRCDGWTWLAQQWIVAQLNVCAGACMPDEVEDVLDQAGTLLRENCCGFAGLWLLDMRAGLLAKVLEQYNAGLIGPKACDCEIPKCPPCKKRKGNNGVGNGYDPQPPGNPPVNDGAGTGPGHPGNRGGAGDKGEPTGGKGRYCPDLLPPKAFSEFPCEPPPCSCRDCEKKCRDCDGGCSGCGDKKKHCKECNDCKKRCKGNNGVGNGIDPQPPGDPPVNDGPGTGPGKPGNHHR